MVALKTFIPWPKRPTYNTSKFNSRTGDGVLESSLALGGENEVYFFVMIMKQWKSDRAIFVKQTNGNTAIWLVYRTDTNARGFWLVKRTLGWKDFMPENFLEFNRYFALTSYCNTIGQSNNAFSILGFSLSGKRRVHVLIFSSIDWWNHR